MTLPYERLRRLAVAVLSPIGFVTFFPWGLLENSIVRQSPRIETPSTGEIFPYFGAKGALVYLTANQFALMTWTYWISHVLWVVTLAVIGWETVFSRGTGGAEGKQ